MRNNQLKAGYVRPADVSRDVEEG